MSIIDSKTVEKLADLSRLELSAEETTQMTGELEKIVEFISQLQEVPTEGVEPMASTIAAEGLREREDEVTEENLRDSYMSVSPASELGFYVVPRVVE